MRGFGYLKDSRQHRISIAEDIVVPETEDSISSLDQDSRPPRIGRASDCVLRTIKLYDQPALKTREVRNVASDWVLASELEASESAGPETLPDQSLGIS